jgi:hypothetical protein
MRRLLRFRDAAVSAVVLVGFIAIAAAGWTAGKGFGEPEKGTLPEIAAFAAESPPQSGGFFGYEAINDLLRLGGWGTVTSAELVTPELEGAQASLHVTIRGTGGAESTLILANEDFVRIFADVAPQSGDRIIIRREADGRYAVLVTRLGESNAQ